jgi:hypothetical protein
LSCVISLDMTAVDDFGIANPRECLGGALSIPAGARVHLRLGRARAVSLVYLDLLVRHLQPASSVEIQADDSIVALELYSELSAAFAAQQQVVA